MNRISTASWGEGNWGSQTPSDGGPGWGSCRVSRGPGLRECCWRGWDPTPSMVCPWARQPEQEVLDMPQQERQVQWCGHGDHSQVSPGRGKRLCQVEGERPSKWGIFVRSRQLPMRSGDATRDTTSLKALCAHRAQAAAPAFPSPGLGHSRGPFMKYKRQVSGSWVDVGRDLDQERHVWGRYP